MDAMSNPVEPAPRALVLTRDFDAPRRLVFQAWNEPAQVARWWGPDGFTNPVCELDARAGGAIRIHMRGPDGTLYPMTGTFREVAPPERVVFSSAALDGQGRPVLEVLTTVTFTERRGRTTVRLQAQVLEVAGEGTQYVAGMREGWTQSLERLAEHLAATRSTASEREIVISREFDAPREVVWKAWTDPEQVVRWWGPRGFSTTIETMDVRPGGVWKHVMHGPDGTDYPNKSVFTEVVEPERIVYSHGGGRQGGPGVSFQATWTFEAIGDGRTRLTLRQVYASAADRERTVKEFNAVEGGRQTLARLAEYLAGERLVVERTFDAPIEAVWKAITDLEQLRQWSFELLASFEPKVGFTTEFNVRKRGQDVLHKWRVTEVVPGRKIAYTWSYGGYPGESLVTFELTPDGGRTRLTLTHEGLDTFLPEAHPELARESFVQGWTQLIGTSLRAFLERIASPDAGAFVVTRDFDAPREKVWKAWTEPDRLRAWWGPKGFEMVSLKLDLRPGGSFHYAMRSPDGHEMWGKFVYREVDAPERIVLVNSFSDENGSLTRHPMSPTWPLEVLSTLTLDEHDGRTTLRMQGHPINATEEEKTTFVAGFDSMRQGFAGTFDQLDVYLARA